MKFDLHCHSHYSDGKHSPSFLVHRALANQVTHLAITDHDCTAAIGEVKDISAMLTLIPGVEISCEWQRHEIHIVGLCINSEEPQLESLLLAQQAGRRARLKEMGNELQKLGIDGLIEYCAKLTCKSLSRSHVADFLVEKGIVKNRQKAFKTFLTKGGRIFVEPNWCDMTEAVDAIHNAKGLSILAHPTRYPLSKRKLTNLVYNFAIAGCDALEVSYGNIDLHTQKHLTEIALAKSLHVSAGSDFHDSNAHWTDIGKYPTLEERAKKNAIWEHPKWHS